MTTSQRLLLALVRVYQRAVSPLLTSLFGPMGMGCRFTPTCSEYAAQSVRAHGALRGVWLAFRRLGKCHPWGGYGPDPVPPSSRSPHPAKRAEPWDPKPDSSLTTVHPSRIHGS